MKRMLINATQKDEVRVAITDNAQLIDLDIETPGQEQKKSNIYKGVISSIEPSLCAVFVNYGSERHGFLPLKEISPEYFLTEAPQDIDSIDIYRVLKIGQELVVQIDKEERGTKGAALTTFISLAGSFLVLMPNNPQAGGISRRIESEERDQIRDLINQLNVPENMGLIVRTAGHGRSIEELRADLSELLRYWEAIKQAAIMKSGSYLIHQEGDVITRAIRDYMRQDIHEIIIDDKEAYDRARNYLLKVRPDFVDRIKLYQDSLPLFSRFQIEQQIENAYQREVRLPSGGSLIIDQSEALIAIDINSGRATRSVGIEETALQTNLEAAEEIARQLRIRDIGGLVVIDFIDMTPVRNQREVENCLRNALRNDRARIQVGRISRFGLLEMSRQRLRTSLTKSTQMTCPRCNGQGSVRGVDSLGLSIIHLIQEQSAKAKYLHFQIQLPVDVATYLINEKRDVLNEIEKQCLVKITIIPNQFLESPHYQFKQTKIDPASLDHSKGTPSYQLSKTIKAEPSKKPEIKPFIEPAIQQFLSVGHSVPITPSSARKTSPGLFKRLMAKMFGSEPVDTPVINKRPESVSDFGNDPKHRNQRLTNRSRSPRYHTQKRRSRRGSRGGHSRRQPRDKMEMSSTSSTSGPHHEGISTLPVDSKPTPPIEIMDTFVNDDFREDLDLKQKRELH